jgi:hypothetical protein
MSETLHCQIGGEPLPTREENAVHNLFHGLSFRYSDAMRATYLSVDKDSAFGLPNILGSSR